MITSLKTALTCILKDYTPGWEVGSGIPAAVAPGTYHITDESQVAGVTYWNLDETYRVDSRRVSPPSKS